MKKYLLIPLLFFSARSLGQDLKALSTEANLQKTANTKDILTSLFRAGIDNVLGKNHSFALNSSFFGIDSMFRKKGSTLNYKKERFLRQESFNILITGDSANNITKLSGGFTFTILNGKDVTQKKLDPADFNRLVAMSNFVVDLRKGVIDVISRRHPDEFDKGTLSDSIEKSWSAAAKNHDFSDLHPFISEALKDSGLVTEVIRVEGSGNGLTGDEVRKLIGATIKGEDGFHELYKNIAEKYARRPLWTFSPACAYDRVHKQGEYSFASDFTVGLVKDPSKKPWELEVQALFKIGNDSTNANNNYDNKPLSVSLAVNKVLLQNEEKESKMEFKFFTQYDHQFGKIAVAEKNVFTLNSTLRINIFKSLWLPITLKYDPKHSNFFGYFAITANLGN